MTERPIARHEDLIIEEIPGETLVYDFTTDRAHCLNQMAALIWKHCDGQNSVSQIAGLIEHQLKLPVSEQIVMLGLEELAGSKLLKQEADLPKKAGVSRRQLMKNLGLTAAVGLPVIVSIIAPTAAHAATFDPCASATDKGIGCPCSSDNECSSFNCNVAECGPAL